MGSLEALKGVMFSANGIRELYSLYVIFIFARDDAEDAIDSMDGRTFEGRELRVQLAK